jgi:hypothetical protein
MPPPGHRLSFPHRRLLDCQFIHTATFEYVVVFAEKRRHSRFSPRPACGRKYVIGLDRTFREDGVFLVGTTEQHPKVNSREPTKGPAKA